jgi:hypothetical protein
MARERGGVRDERQCVGCATVWGMACAHPGVGDDMWPRRSILGVFAALALAVAACSDDDAPAVDTTAAMTPTTAPDAPPLPEPGRLPDGPSALVNMVDASFPDPLVDPRDIISGGPPPDGIPPIDEPHFVRVDEVEWLRDDEPVVVVEIDGDARAYPVQILIWHEIVNDTVGGVPVAITYCPLCNSAVSYVRTINGVETTFGTSGRLFASALVMYDRATESLWTHFDGWAVVGVLAGHRLDPVPSPLISWSEFKAAHPEGQVLDKFRTGHVRRYGENPYVGYDDPDGFPFLFRGDVDARARAMERVVGVEVDGVARAWLLDAVSAGEAWATNDRVGDSPVVIFWRAGQRSAIHQFTTDIGRMVGSVGVFSPVVNGEVLTFAGAADGFVDVETGSHWDITGTAVDGPLRGVRLDRFHHLDTFWFAWSTYQPDTDLIEEIAEPVAAPPAIRDAAPPEGDETTAEAHGAPAEAHGAPAGEDGVVGPPVALAPRQSRGQGGAISFAYF